VSTRGSLVLNWCLIASTLSRATYRTLDFNLRKDDRVSLHRRIASGKLAPETLVRMSSEELASEDQQKSRREIEEEALAQSILQKQRAPRAKITHKGLEDIEDINGNLTNQREREEEQEEARARRDRERLARLRPVNTTTAQSPTSSVPPETPQSAVSASWGAPPPVPMQLGSTNPAASPVTRPPTAPLFYHTQSDLAVPTNEHDIDLGDFIHMDDEPPLVAEKAVPSTLPTPALELDEPPTLAPQPTSPVTPQTAISPFAPSKPDMPPRASFDLNSVWTAPKPPDRPPTPPPDLEEQKEVAMDIDGDSGEQQTHGGSGNNDLDFDMFLSKEDEDERPKSIEPEKPQMPPPNPQEIFNNLPRVWSGTVGFSAQLFEKPDAKRLSRSLCLLIR
jgi:hypothetical protein